MNEEASFPWQTRIATKRCNLFTSKKSVLGILNRFHPILDGRNIIKIVLVFIFRSVVVVVVVVVVVNFCFLHYHTNFEWQDKIWIQLEETILMGTCRFVIFSALHTNKVAQFLCKHTSSIM